jgi:hypothetical protein
MAAIFLVLVLTVVFGGLIAFRVHDYYTEKKERSEKQKDTGA